jgi:acyl-CoA hydrolase
MLMGTSRLYGFADRNPAIQIRAASYIHDALVLGNFRRFVAINGALEVDLTGHVNAETARGRHIGLVGGQMDFIRAALICTLRRQSSLSKFHLAVNYTAISPEKGSFAFSSA